MDVALRSSRRSPDSSRSLDGTPPTGLHPRSGRSGARGGISCEEALARVYEYLDGELDPELQERVHEHLEVCRRCYPCFNFERLFLDDVHERGLSVEENPRLKRRVEALLDEIE